jgi:hypothetical protein
MDYGEVLSRAGRIIWKYKVLWLFGILAGLGSAAGNSGGFSNSGFRQNLNFNTPAGANQFLFRVQQFFQNIPIWAWVLFVLALLVLFVIVVILNTVGRIGLVQGAVQGDEDVAGLSFGPLFNTSFRYFWRVFLLDLLVGLAIAIVVTVIVVGIVLIGVATLGVALICLVPLLCVLVPLLIAVGWLVEVVLEQSIIAIVAEDRGIGSGLERGWGLVRSNFGTFIVMALILFIGGGVIGFLIALPESLALVPIVLGLMSGARGASLVGVGIGILVFLVYLPVLLLLTGVLRAYITTAWTLTFRRLSRALSVTPAPEVIPPAAPAGE